MASYPKIVAMFFAGSLMLTVGISPTMAAMGMTSPSMSNPCHAVARNPCAVRKKIDKNLLTRPAGTQLMVRKRQTLIKEGQRLWHDKSLGTNGLSCDSCHHNHAAFRASFAKPYPHYVTMPDQQAGMKKIHLDEMIQFCMISSLAAKPLPWNSRKLAALTAYTETVQKSFKPSAPMNNIKGNNPCYPNAMGKIRNPCQPKMANPCASKR